jgi:hypothetical protein
MLHGSWKSLSQRAKTPLYVSLSLLPPAYEEPTYSPFGCILKYWECFDPANPKQMISSFHSPFKIIYCSLHPA